LRPHGYIIFDYSLYRLVYHLDTTNTKA
jgi:hypothetical protein